MLRILFTILISFLTSSYLLAQDNSNDEKSNSKLTIEELKENLDGLTDRVVTTENDLINLKKIKISGYLQSDWLRFDQKDNVGGKAFIQIQEKIYLQYEEEELNSNTNLVHLLEFFNLIFRKEELQLKMFMVNLEFYLMMS